MKRLIRTINDFIHKPRSAKQKRVLIINSVLAGAPIVLMFCLLATWSVNAPFWDQWIYADFIDKLHRGTLTFHDLWQQHNEHRIFVPELILLGLALLTHWNVRIEIFMNFIAVIATYMATLLIAYKTIRQRIAFAVVAVVAAWLLFSPLAYINWIWGFQFVFFFSVLCLIVSVWALQKQSAIAGFSKWFWVALAFAFAGTYSVGNGMLVWVAGVVMLLLARANAKKLVTWISSSVVAIAIYFYHFAFETHDSISILWHRPLDVLQYVLIYLGHPFGYDSSTALIAGSILLTVAVTGVVALTYKKQLVRAAPWLAIGSYALFTSGLAAIARLSTFGIQQSMAFSYVTISTLFVLSTIALAVMAFLAYKTQIMRARPKTMLASGALIGLIAYPLANGYVQNYFIGTQKMYEQSQHLKEVRTCIYQATSANDDCLLGAYPNKAQAWKYFNILHDIHWGNF